MRMKEIIVLIKKKEMIGQRWEIVVKLSRINSYLSALLWNWTTSDYHESWINHTGIGRGHTYIQPGFTPE